jgi:hypothetical protein
MGRTASFKYDSPKVNRPRSATGNLTGGLNLSDFAD